MKNRDLILVIESLANEKNIAPETIFRGIEKAMSSVLSRSMPGEVDIRTTIDRKTGEFNSKRIWTIVSDHEFENPDAQIELNSAQSTYGNVSIGDEVEEDIDQEALGQLKPTTQNIFTRFVKEAERAKYAEHYESLIGEVISSKVKRVTRETIIIELPDGVEGHLSRSNLLPARYSGLAIVFAPILSKSTGKWKAHYLSFQESTQRWFLSYLDLKCLK